MTLDPEKIRSVVQVCLTTIFIVAGFAVLLFGLGQEGTAGLAPAGSARCSASGSAEREPDSV